MSSNADANQNMSVGVGAALVTYDAIAKQWVGNVAAPGNQTGILNAQLVSTDGFKPTYGFAISAFAPVATPTCFVLIQGSASKTGRIKHLKIQGAATANGAMVYQISRWSTAGTKGSAVLAGVTAVPFDVTNDTGATCVVSTVGTNNYTTQGTGNGTLLAAGRIPMPAITTGGSDTYVSYDFPTTKAWLLRGTSDFIAISGGGSAVPAGGVIDLEVFIEEDNS
jgi:hypothetical protein